MDEAKKRKRVLCLMAEDTRLLFKRIFLRKDEYVNLFALKRTREHFENIFRTKFEDFTPELLSNCELKDIELFYEFHERVEELKWYLLYTDDMPNAIDEKISRKLHEISMLFQNFSTYLEGEIYGEAQEIFPPLPEEEEDES